MRRARQRKTLREQRRRALLLGATGAALISPAAADAAVFTVSNLNDSGANSLRAAVIGANAVPGDDEIKFVAGGDAGVIRLTTGELPITGTDGLTITGPGRGQLSISGDADDSNTGNAGDSRVFNISGGNSGTAVAISGLTITEGYSTNSGGAILLGSGDLSLTDAAVTQSSTTDTDGGGGIDATGGALTLTRSLVTGNTATAGEGGGVVSDEYVTVDHGTVSGNSAGSGGGVAVVGGGNLKVLDSTVDGNHATSMSGSGGGLLAEAAGLRVERSTITNNTGASGAGVLAYTAKYGSGVYDSTVTGNTATSVGGGVVLAPIKYEAKVSQTTVSGNSAPTGAGLAMTALLSAGAATLERSTVKGNTATGTDSLGGGIAFLTTSGANRVVDSTVTGNTATHGGGVSVGALNQPALKYMDNGKQPGSIDLDNSTIAGNTGGGVFINSYDSNSMPTARKAATIGLSSTIVAGNAGGDTDRADDATNGGISAAFSLVQTPGDAPLTSTAVITGKDPLLGALADNGGPTQTLLPAGTSPALDAGRAPFKLKVDQRGLARTANTGLGDPAGGGDGTDIGAVELPASAVVVPPAPTPSPNPTAAPDPALTVTAGALPIATGTPLLPASLTPLTCSVTIVKLTSCDVAIRATGPIKLTKKRTLPTGTLLAEAQPSSAEGAATLGAKALLTTDGKAVLKKLPLGVDARAVGIGSYAGSSAVTAAGRVHLLAGPTVTLKLTKGTKLSKSVKTQLGQLGTLLTGAKTVSVSASGPSKTKAATVAKAAGAALTSGGVKAVPTTAGKKAKTRLLKVTFTL